MTHSSKKFFVVAAPHAPCRHRLVDLLPDLFDLGKRQLDAPCSSVKNPPQQLLASLPLTLPLLELLQGDAVLPSKPTYLRRGEDEDFVVLLKFGKPRKIAFEIN